MHDDKLILYIGRKPAMHQEKGQKRSQPTKKMLKQKRVMRLPKEVVERNHKPDLVSRKIGCLGRAVRNKPLTKKRSVNLESNLWYHRILPKTELKQFLIVCTNRQKN